MTLNDYTPAPPHDEPAETAIIVSILKRPSRLTGLAVRPTDFYCDPHRRAFAAMLAVQARGEAITYGSVGAQMAEDGWPWPWHDSAEHGALVFLADLPLDADSIPYPGCEDRGFTRRIEPSTWTQELLDCSRRRRVLSVIADVAAEAWRRDRPFDGREAVAAVARASQPPRGEAMDAAVIDL